MVEPLLMRPIMGKAFRYSSVSWRQMDGNCKSLPMEARTFSLHGLPKGTSSPITLISAEESGWPLRWAEARDKFPSLVPIHRGHGMVNGLPFSPDPRRILAPTVRESFFHPRSGRCGRLEAKLVSFTDLGPL